MLIVAIGTLALISRVEVDAFLTTSIVELALVDIETLHGRVVKVETWWADTSRSIRSGYTVTLAIPLRLVDVIASSFTNVAIMMHCVLLSSRVIVVYRVSVLIVVEPLCEL